MTFKNNFKNVAHDGINYLQNENKLAVKSFMKNERKLLKVFLLGRLYQIFCELFQNKIQDSQYFFPTECYKMDSKVIQVLIQCIISTGEYTLEGIAHYTHIPFDVIYEAACGINKQFSIIPWSKITDLYLQVNPHIEQVLIDKLLEIKNKSCSAFSLLLKEA